MKQIPYGKQFIDSTDIQAVTGVLESDWITQGPKVKEFEDALAKYCGSKFAVAVSSGTAALHLACLAAGLGPGDEAVTSPITFLATPNSIVYSGAKPVFADIDYDTVNIDCQQIKNKITRKTKVVIPVHFAGLPCDMRKIYSIARAKRQVIIEDAAHALGAQYKVNGKWFKVGSCSHSDMAIFSFHPVKHITTGEGGAITTNDRKIYEKLLMLRSHGITRDPDKFLFRRRADSSPWYYEMQCLGFNYRLTDFQCALGISQLGKIGLFLGKRSGIAKKYGSFFKGLAGVEAPLVGPEAVAAWHLYVLKIDYKRFGLTRQGLVSRLKEKNIHTQVHYIPVYRQPFYKTKFKLSHKDFPRAEKYYERALSMPIYYGLNDKDLNYVMRSVKAALN